ncbi:hypothetical protein ACEE86_10680, partial [Proteus mirabilis]
GEKHPVKPQVFRQRREQSVPSNPAQQTPRFTPAGYKNAEGFFAVIISAGLATLTELKTSIDLEEAFDLWEIAITNRYNEALASS